MARPQEHKFGMIIRTPIPAPATYIHTNIVPRPNVLSRDRLIKLVPAPEGTRTALDCNQRECIFFRLPAEIRSRIYALALCSLYLRIQYEPHKHSIRQENRKRYKEHMVGGLWCHTYDLTSSPITNIKVNHRSPASHRRHKLTLLPCTCRQMCADTVLLHFELNVFSFNDALVMHKWMMQLKPVQKRALRRLDLTCTGGIGVTLKKQLIGLHRLWVAGTWMDVQHYLHGTRQRKAMEEDEQA